MHHLIRTACATALLAAGFAAHAGTVTFNSWFHGNGNKVSVSLASPAVSFGGLAGAFKVTLSGFGADFNTVFEAYCVELTQSISLPGGPYSYNLVTAASYFSGKAGVADRLTSLISYANTSNLLATAADKDAQSTALQLAVWNTVYDTDTTLTAAPGATLSDSTAYGGAGAGAFQNANQLLANAGAQARAQAGYSLYVLQSGTTQDQVIWLRNQVPEPSSLALVALALGGLGLAARRRQA